MSIKDLSINDRPREKLLLKGASSLSDVELIAIIIGSGTKGKSALDIANDLYSDKGLTRLIKTPFRDLKKYKGIKDVNAIKLAATFELSKRILSAFQTSELTEINKDYIVKKYSPMCFGMEKEMLGVVILDKNKNLVGETTLYKGRKNVINALPNEIISEVIKYDGKYFYIYHNHPSKRTSPSMLDINFTTDLIVMANQLGYQLLDHIIFTDSGYFSFQDDEYHLYDII